MWQLFEGSAKSCARRGGHTCVRAAASLCMQELVFYLSANVPPALLGRGACMPAAADLQNPDSRTQGRAKDPSFWTEPQESSVAEPRLDGAEAPRALRPMGNESRLQTPTSPTGAASHGVIGGGG